MKMLNDKQIWDLIVNKDMIHPAINRLVSEERKGKVISYGLSSAGYDIRVADEFFVFEKNPTEIIDPKEFDSRVGFSTTFGNYMVLPPKYFVLARSLEYIKMPRNVVGVVQGKSTYARCGIITPVTPLEPGWEGHITLEIFNASDSPAKIYVNEGICQVTFFQIDDPITSYADRKGKYQGQIGITFPRV